MGVCMYSRKGVLSIAEQLTEADHPWRSTPSYSTRLQSLDNPTTFSHFDYLRTMLLDVCGANVIRLTHFREVINLDFRCFRSKTDAFHLSSLFVSFPRTMLSLVKLSSICFHFHINFVTACTLFHEMGFLMISIFSVCIRDPYM